MARRAPAAWRPKHVSASGGRARREARSGNGAGGEAPDVQISKFMSYDAAAKTIKLKLNSAHGSNNGGMNFSSGFSGSRTITVPIGWRVSWAFTQVRCVPHSAIVLPNKMPFPAQPQDPAIPRAYTKDVTAGLATGKTMEVRRPSRRSPPRTMRDRVRRSGTRAEWHVDHFDVSADAKVPAYATK